MEPIAQCLGIVITGTEPAIVHDKQLNACFLAGFCQAQEFVFIDVEIRGFPAVQEHRTCFLLPDAADDAVSDKGVHILAHAIVAVDGVRHHSFGRFESISRCQVELEGTGIDTGDQTHFTECIGFHSLIVVATVNQVEAIAFASCFAGVLSGQHHKRIGTVGRAAAVTFINQLAHAHRHFVFLHFPCPGTMEGGEGPISSGEIQLKAHEPFQGNGILAGVDELCRAGDHIVFLEYEIMKLQSQVILIILQGNGQFFDISVFLVGTGEGSKRSLSGGDFRLLKEKIRGITAVSVGYFDERLPNITLAMGRHFQADIFQAQGRVIGAVCNGIAGEASAFFN